MHDQAPRKLFREEAQTQSAQCPACGAPLELKGFGGIERVVCPYCGSESSPASQGPLELLAKAQRQRRPSALPLYQRGTLEGAPWEIIGIVWRECMVDGVDYPWQEFLLFNPYRGYRYLVYSMSDGHWTLGEVLPGAAQYRGGIGHKRVAFAGKTYKHFQSVTAEVSYVEGEFPWQVHVGDTAEAHEYIAPPTSISIEQTFAEEGQDLNFTRMAHIDAAAVWKAFGMPGRPPPQQGIGPCRPNPWHRGSGTTWALLGGLLVLWLLSTVIYVGKREPKVIFNQVDVAATQNLREEVEVTGDGPTVLELEVRAPRLSNQWLTLDVVMSPADSDKGLAFAATAEEWHGNAGGESWREGDTTPTVTIGNVVPGKYLLEVTPAGGTQSGTDVQGIEYSVTLRQDVVLLRYALLSLLVILLIPFLYWLMGRFYEGRRWANSDYGSSE